MEVSVTKRDLMDIKNLIATGGLVQLMNDEGLSFGAMAFVLQMLNDATDDALREMGSELEEDE